MNLHLTWRQRREDPPVPVPQNALCWCDKEVRKSPAEVLVRPGFIDTSSAKILLGSNVFLAGEKYNAAFYFQVVVFPRRETEKSETARSGSR